MSIPSLDPHYDKTVLLLPMDGANNGLVFPDYSANPKTITRFGDTKTVTAVKKYGTASAYFDGVDDYLQVGGTPLLPATGDWTIECWIYRAVSGVDHQIYSQGDAGIRGRTFLVVSSNTLNFFVGSTTNLNIYSVATIPAQTWTHVAATRNGNTFRMFVNGKLDGSAVLDQAIDQTSLNIIGKNQSAALPRQFNGYIDDLRITKGVARYTANFTPPGPLVVDANAISGTVTDRNGNPAVRKLFAMPRVMPSRVFGPVTSGVDGTYTFSNLPAAEYSLVALADDSDPLQNDIIHRVNVGAL